MMISTKLTRSFFSCLLAFSLTLLPFQSALAQHSSIESLDLEQVQALETDIVVKAGVLKLSTQERERADLHFWYSREEWKPEISLNKEAGQLSIRQPEEGNGSIRDREENEWELSLPRQLSGGLRLRMGAGEGFLDLQGARLDLFKMEVGAGDFEVNLAGSAVSELEVNAGVGALSLDVSGRRSNDLEAHISGGIGSLELVLPASTGVRVKINGLGGVDSDGFRKQDGYYVNDAYGQTTYQIDITVNGGLGGVELVLDREAN